MATWFANRHRGAFPGGIFAEIEFSRTTSGSEGWEWQLWRDDPDEPIQGGREPTLQRAKAAAARAAKKHHAKGDGM